MAIDSRGSTPLEEEIVDGREEVAESARRSFSTVDVLCGNL